MAIQQSGENFQKQDTATSIASDKVEGTPVYRSNGEKVGKIERLMIDKTSGRVTYAVLSFGGFLGIGDDYYPLPWSLLKFSERLGGYEVNITDEQLKGAPKFKRNETFDWADQSGRRVYDYYRTPYV
jgi:sporulation protein YlmC with PRC-barrel domain